MASTVQVYRVSRRGYRAYIYGAQSPGYVEIGMYGCTAERAINKLLAALQRRDGCVMTIESATLFFVVSGTAE